MEIQGDILTESRNVVGEHLCNKSRGSLLNGCCFIKNTK